MYVIVRSKHSNLHVHSAYRYRFRHASYYSNSNNISRSALTDKKENQNFPSYKEIQNGAVAKLYITNGLLIHIWGNISPFPHILGIGIPSSYMTLQLLHSEFPYIWGKSWFSFSSALLPLMHLIGRICRSRGNK